MSAPNITDNPNGVVRVQLIGQADLFASSPSDTVKINGNDNGARDLDAACRGLPKPVFFGAARQFKYDAMSADIANALRQQAAIRLKGGYLRGRYVANDLGAESRGGCSGREAW